MPVRYSQEFMRGTSAEFIPRVTNPLAMLLLTILIGTLSVHARADEKPVESGAVSLMKKYAAAYDAKPTPAVIKLDAAHYLSIEGKGSPAGAEFQKKIGRLYQTAFMVKMKWASQGKDYDICPLEAIWWAPNSKDASFQQTPPESWQWKLILRVPPYVTQENVDVINRGAEEGEGKAKVEVIDEGTCIQVLHEGPYATEPESIAKMSEFAAAQKLEFHGRHHEIYLNNPNQVAPEALRTILRYPVRKVRDSTAGDD